jgi:hypothetical protein
MNPITRAIQSFTRTRTNNTAASPKGATADYGPAGLGANSSVTRESSGDSRVEMNTMVPSVSDTPPFV